MNRFLLFGYAGMCLLSAYGLYVTHTDSRGALWLQHLTMAVFAISLSLSILLVVGWIAR